MTAGKRRVATGSALVLALVIGIAAQSAAAAGSEPQPRIVGGSTTTIEEWPWQAAVAWNDELYSGNGYQRQFCGGSLVAPTIVVTAAHCVFGDPFPGFNPASQFEVFTGRTTLSSSQGQAIDVAEVYYFVDAGGTPEEEAQSGPDEGPRLFNKNTLVWDTAFLELEAASTSQSILIAGADETDTWTPGSPAFVTGWGSVSQSGGFPDNLREGEVEMISDAFCDSAAIYGPDFFPETMVCAGFEEGGVDTCSGDSGGPLVVPIAGGGFRLVGSTSWGEGCAQPNAPGVYGRLADDPMRAALEGGIFDVAGVDVTGSGADPPAPQPPVLTPIGDRSVDEGDSLQFTVSATDPNGGPLTYSASNLPAGATFTPATRQFSWTPDFDQAGSYPGVRFEVTDGGLTASEEITITVDDAVPPTDATDPQTTIDSGPKKKTRRRRARFEFSSSEPGSGFECKLDKKDFAPCEAPFKKKVRRKRHTFQVRAIDEAGNVDTSPASYRWKVKKKR